MNKAVSSNLSGSTIKSPHLMRALNESAPSKKQSAPSIYEYRFMVEEPNPNDSEMLNQINCISCNNDITKRWYVEYYIVCSETKKRIRKREYGYVNKEKDPVKRLQLLIDLKDQVIGNVEFDKVKLIEPNISERNSITYFLNDYMDKKRKVLEDETIRTYLRVLKSFHKFLIKNNISTLPPVRITQYHVQLYHDQLCGKVCNRTVNNYKETLKSFFTFLIKKHKNILYINPCDTLDKLPNKSESHVAYTKTEAEAISEYLLKHDKQFLDYCRCVGLGFLRCKETRRLQVKHIDFDRKAIVLTAKNAKTGERVTKPMLDVFYDHLIKMNLKNLPPDYYIFTSSGIPGPKIAYEGYFKKKFKAVKDHFNLSNKHTVYSFRHTFVCELLDSGASWHEIMKYTGHTTFAAFEKYARSIMNKPAVDLSSNITIRF